MANLKDVEQSLNTYIRPLTFPLAIKMLKSENEIPEKTRRPFQQMKKKVAICQGIGMARKLGWAVAMGKEDMQCSLGAAPFGFFENIEFFNEGNIAAGMFTASKEINVFKKTKGCGSQRTLHVFLAHGHRPAQFPCHADTLANGYLFFHLLKGSTCFFRNFIFRCQHLNGQRKGQRSDVGVQ